MQIDTPRGRGRVIRQRAVRRGNVGDEHRNNDYNNNSGRDRPPHARTPEDDTGESESLYLNVEGGRPRKFDESFDLVLDPATFPCDTA
jgi:hypothetical protein